MSSRSFLAVAMWGVVSGCYTYARTPEPVTPHVEVALLMSTEAQLRLRERLGLDVRELHGRVVDVSPDSLMVEVPSTSPFVGVGGGSGGGDQLYQRVDLARSDVLETRTRVPSPVRTAALLAGVGAGTAVILATQVFTTQNPGQIEVTPTGPDDRRSFVDLRRVVPE